LPEGENILNTTGDEEAFVQAKSLAASNEIPNLEMVASMQSTIGQRCRLRRVADEISAPGDATYSLGSATGWRTKKTMWQYNDLETGEPAVTEKEETVWSLSMDKGGEEEVGALELVDSLIRAKKWKHQYPGYTEHDSPLFGYRNKIGRFCGRAVDAPYAASPSFFSKLILKREQECYQSLKSRSYENNWGGKSGLRNAWIVSMKENFDEPGALRRGLLTLEEAFHELCGGFENLNTQDGDEEDINSAKELLENDNLRSDVELESLGLKISGLWHCRESRLVFREIISTTDSLGILALSLDLLCRNCQTYLEATKPTVTRKSVTAASNYDQGMYQAYSSSGRLTRSSYSTEQQTTSRRLNSWQQQNALY